MLLISRLRLQRAAGAFLLVSGAARAQETPAIPAPKEAPKPVAGQETQEQPKAFAAPRLIVPRPLFGGGAPSTPAPACAIPLLQAQLAPAGDSKMIVKVPEPNRYNMPSVQVLPSCDAPAATPVAPNSPVQPAAPANPR